VKKKIRVTLAVALALAIGAIGVFAGTSAATSYVQNELVHGDFADNDVKITEASCVPSGVMKFACTAEAERDGRSLEPSAKAEDKTQRVSYDVYLALNGNWLARPVA